MRDHVRRCVITWALLSATLHTFAATDATIESVRALTSAWRLAWVRPVPVARAAAAPLVVAAGRNQRLWIADQNAGEVQVYTTRGRQLARLKVAKRGVISALDFDRADRLLVAQQRRELRVPLGDVRVFEGSSSSAGSYRMIRSRTYPKYWTGRSVAEEIELARARGEYTAFTPPDQLVMRGAAITPRGSVFVIVPVLSTMERFSADGATASTYMMTELRPWSPCWVIATRDGELVLGDARNERMLLMDTAGRAKAAWPVTRVGEQIACARPGRGWLMLDPRAHTMAWYGREGVSEGQQRLPAAYEAVAMPDARTLWLFDTNEWTWHEYQAID